MIDLQLLKKLKNPCYDQASIKYWRILMTSIHQSNHLHNHKSPFNPNVSRVSCCFQFIHWAWCKFHFTRFYYLQFSTSWDFWIHQNIRYRERNFRSEVYAASVERWMMGNIFKPHPVQLSQRTSSSNLIHSSSLLIIFLLLPPSEFRHFPFWVVKVSWGNLSKFLTNSVSVFTTPKFRGW